MSEERLVLRGAAPDRDLTTLAGYRGVGGYEQLARAFASES